MEQDGSNPIRINCVILNFNDGETVARLVHMIHDYDYLEKIVLVDNHSTDDSWEQLQVLKDEKVELIRTEKKDYFIDLVFYNYILKSFVLIDLKTTTITHQDVGQMDMYVRMYDERVRGEGDNPTIGIVLCSETDEDIARYSVLHDNDHLFASKYMLYMPTEEELREEIERQKEFYRLQHDKLTM